MIRLLFTALTFFTCIIAQAQGYQFYFGNIHAHSSYSDGNKDDGINGGKLPRDNYAYAQQSYNFHFLGISEHNHSEAGMKLTNYKKGLQQADSANKNGRFVTMFGMEYGVISNGGHVLVYGIDSLIGWNAGNYDIYSPQYDYASLWKLIATRPNAFATLAHPETSDYNNLSTAAFNDTADMAICGSAIRSGGAFSQTTDYSDGPPSTTYTGYFRRMLAAGYKLGPTIDHDNHYSTFGRTAQSRTVVLAQALNRDSLMAAYKARRFYASDDWNTQVNFTINASPMGSEISTQTNPTINVDVSDIDSGDAVSSIKVYYGIPGSKSLSTLLTSVNNSEVLSYTHNMASGSTYYFYAEITQADGDKIYTSPIWVYKEFSVLSLNDLLLAATADGENIKLAALILTDNFKKIELQKSFNGNAFSLIKSFEEKAAQLSYTDKTPIYGHQFYRLKCTNKSGQISYSKIVSVNFVDDRIRIASIYPNPVISQATIIFTSKVEGNAAIKIYNSGGTKVKELNYMLINGNNRIVEQFTQLSTGRYFITAEIGAIKTSTSFVKQ